MAASRRTSGSLSVGLPSVFTLILGISVQSADGTVYPNDVSAAGLLHVTWALPVGTNPCGHVWLHVPVKFWHAAVLTLAFLLTTLHRGGISATLYPETIRIRHGHGGPRRAHKYCHVLDHTSALERAGYIERGLGYVNGHHVGFIFHHLKRTACYSVNLAAEGPD
jgi:hypothetical protein